MAHKKTGIFHIHKFVGSRIFEGARVFTQEGIEPVAERYVAAKGYICRKCGRGKVKYYNVYGMPCDISQVPEEIRRNVNAWMRGEKVNNLLTFGPRM